MLSTSQPRDLHSTLPKLKLQSLVTINHSRRWNEHSQIGQMVFRITGIRHQPGIHSRKIKINHGCNLKTQDKGLYIEHSDEKLATVKVSLQDRIEEIFDIATNPSNFERVFNMSKVISIKETSALSEERQILQEIS